jgi:hypothetical protein
MSIRKEVREFVEMGPIPDSDSVTEEQLDRLGAAIDKITRPITREEAALLLTVFGPDECYGLAWTLLHLIESVPGGVPIEEEPGPDANEWVRGIWNAMQRAKQWGVKGAGRRNGQ